MDGRVELTWGAPIARGMTADTFDVVATSPEGDTRPCIGKRLVPRFRADAVAVAQLRDEARVLGALRGDGAPMRIAEGSDEGGPYLVMARVDGVDLGAQELRAALARADTRAFERLARAAFAALARVHAADEDGERLGLVHADICPSNVRVAYEAHGARERFRVTLLDFGLARFRGQRPADAPHGAFRGTLPFAAPEAARSEPLDARADVFSLAASLLYVASGEMPHDAQGARDAHGAREAPPSPAALLVRVAESPLDAYAARAAARLSPAIAHALARCVAFDPAHRPARAGDVFAADPC